jgi:hypothetical protein
MSNLDIPKAALWLPGKGVLSGDVRAAMKAVEDYDRDLTLGRDERTGDWVVCLQRGPMPGKTPVFGLGKDLPPRERIHELLYKNDVRRHGAKIMDAIDRANAERAKANRDEINDQTGVAAEALEWGLRQEGRHPNPRIFIPGRS